MAEPVVIGCAETEKRHVAFHEAAHAAVGYALGRRPVSITLRVQCEVEEGRPLFRLTGSTSAPLPDGVETSIRTVQDYATLAAAGPIAEARWCKSLGLPDRTDRCGKGDRAAIDRAADWAEADPVVFRQAAQKRASAILDDARVWRGIEDLARELGTRWPKAEQPGEHAAAIPREIVEGFFTALNCGKTFRKRWTTNPYQNDQSSSQVRRSRL